MFYDYLKSVFEDNKTRKAIVLDNNEIYYEELLIKLKKVTEYLETTPVQTGSIVALIGDFSPNTIALFIELIRLKCIIVPLTRKEKLKIDKLFEIAKPDFIFNVDEEDNISFSEGVGTSSNVYYKAIKKLKHSGLVLFTSGTSGEPKAAVHDFEKLLKKFEQKGNTLVTINFLMFDHWGGLNTMFHILSNGGSLVITKERTPEEICKLIENHGVELLPASPTFLNLLLLSKLKNKYDLTTLKYISYGTEPMPQHTLSRLKAEFPGIKLLQTYGLIELGVMKSQSESNESLWVKLGGEGFQTRIVDDILQIKADSAMLGYINADSPFTKDGWFITGDKVEQKGEYVRILGRKSEIINVGGEKVYPQEVENIILEMENVAEVTVYSEKNAIMGNIVCANIRLVEEQEKNVFLKDLKNYCKKRMEPYKLPIKINLSRENQSGSRYKKKRFFS